MKNFFIKTFGCQMNVADSDSISQKLIACGYKKCATPKEADIIVVNTCTVRQHAEERAFSFIGELKKFKIKSKKLKIIVVGCVASRLKRKLTKKFPFVDKIIPAYSIHEFDALLDLLPNCLITQSLNRSSFVPISRGCSNFCSYCIVPFVRGPETPRQIKDVMLDVENVVKSGGDEIVLLGQNVNSYECDGTDFANLLIKVNNIPEIKSIGFMTSHPKDMTDKIIETIADCQKISRQIHLPVQSGSNRILKLMNRNYTKGKYLKIIEKLRKKVPGVTFTTDIIVGFPTETEDDFLQTLALVNNVSFSSAFTFKYSPREGTKAFLMVDDVPLEVKKQRLAKLNETLKRIGDGKAKDSE